MGLATHPFRQHITCMSKSLKRVRAALEASGATVNIVETQLARTAANAAIALDCDIDQIAKSIIFKGETSNQAILFVTAGSNRVDPFKAAAIAGEALGKADAALIRSQTGFAIGGVSPIGHINPIRAFVDPRLTDFDEIWAAAGTPNHVFACSHSELVVFCNGQVSDFTI
jgi:prolyl-tRNA editing enzyme YbaK/EbsC (Cys-tRNA(Pro) deacylase)